MFGAFALQIYYNRRFAAASAYVFLSFLPIAGVLQFEPAREARHLTLKFADQFTTIQKIVLANVANCLLLSDAKYESKVHVSRLVYDLRPEGKRALPGLKYFRSEIKSQKRYNGRLVQGGSGVNVDSDLKTLIEILEK